MLDIKRVIHHLNEQNEDVLRSLKETAVTIARTTIRYRLEMPESAHLDDFAEVVDDHLGFVPVSSEVMSFLWLHPKLKSRVMDFGAQDTEVRSEILNAVTLFCVDCEYDENSKALHDLVFDQWNEIWGA